MYKENTFEFILERMFERIPHDIDKREGSVIYDALAPAALELARVYSSLDDVIDETFADTAGREMLIRRAAERGIAPREATFAVVRAEFNRSVPIGTRFSIFGGSAAEGLRYVVTQQIEGFNYRLRCEKSGSVGNKSSGSLTATEYINGLTDANITQVIVPGEDDEDTEAFRKRYFDGLSIQNFGGNTADYRRWTLALPGIGGVKIVPAYQGGGTVLVVVQDSQWRAPSQSVLYDVERSLAGSLNGYEKGNGYGIAPIGHKVYVAPVKEYEIAVNVEVVLKEGLLFGDVRSNLREIAREYITELASEWDRSERLIVRSSHLESKMLTQMNGRVVDIPNIIINYGDFGRNITLDYDSVPRLGLVDGSVVS